MTARNVLVTGASSGIGRAVAELLIARGDRVAVSARRADALAELRAHTTLPCDVADPAARAGLCARAHAALGGLDGLVCAAGVAHHRAPGAIPEQLLREQLEVNLVAPLRLGEEALSVLEPGGAMIFITSTLVLHPIATSLAYSASKAGLLGAMRALAVAGAARGVRAAAVCPGAVDTDMIRTGRSDAELADLRATHPLGRLGTPADVAHAVLYLLDAPWATGTNLVIDGGATL